ncbi:class I SAM-dependent methyltransferase [Aestuariivirga litoralis]|nr:class I SAM-dependent methyltransferase [Aestuariivirga litoralis]
MKELIKSIIETEGPLPMDRYMALCLGHPKLGYYMNRDPFGALGDFTTAPEISQIFGEMIGIWCVAAWEAIGSPDPFLLVELGPGRGTLMQDVLRTTSRMAEFQAAARVHMVETSPVLRKLQQEKLGETVTWHDSIESLPQEPMIFVANEFFDALPVRQIVKRGNAFFERCVGLQDGLLTLVDVPAPRFNFESDGVQEISPVSHAIAMELGARIQALGGAGLVIDYGHLKTGVGDTVQALKNHKPCGILEFPGESDLTAHVDFDALDYGFTQGGAAALPPMTQGAFLKAMGLEQRLTALATKLEGKAQTDFTAGARRLVDDKEMGQLFKVIAVAQAQRQPVYPFEGT